MTDPTRGCGLTTAQMKEAPLNAFYIWPARAPTRYAVDLARFLRRTDLKIARPDWLERHMFDGCRKVIVDHAAKLTEKQWALWEQLTGALPSYDETADTRFSGSVQAVEYAVAGLRQRRATAIEDGFPPVSFNPFHATYVDPNAPAPVGYLRQMITEYDQAPPAPQRGDFAYRSVLPPSHINCRSAPPGGYDPIGRVLSYDPRTGLARIALGRDEVQVRSDARLELGEPVNIARETLDSIFSAESNRPRYTFVEGSRRSGRTVSAHMRRLPARPAIDGAGDEPRRHRVDWSTEPNPNWSRTLDANLNRPVARDEHGRFTRLSGDSD